MISSSLVDRCQVTVVATICPWSDFSRLFKGDSSPRGRRLPSRLCVLHTSFVQLPKVDCQFGVSCALKKPFCVFHPPKWAKSDSFLGKFLASFHKLNLIWGKRIHLAVGSAQNWRRQLALIWASKEEFSVAFPPFSAQHNHNWSAANDRTSPKCQTSL